MPEAKEPEVMRVFGIHTYCDAAGQRHARHSMYTLPKKEVMNKHPTTGKSLVKMGVVKRAEDYDPDVDPPVLRDEDSLDD